MDNVINVEQRVKSLRDEGVSYRKIAERLGISLGKVQRILSVSGVSGSVSIQPQSVSESVSKRIDTPDTVDNKESLAELKLKFNKIIVSMRKDIKANRDDINDIQERVSKAVYTIVKRQTESLRDDLLKTIKEDIKNN